MDLLLPQVAADLHTTVGAGGHGGHRLCGDARLDPAHYRSDQRPFRQIPHRGAYLRYRRRAGGGLRDGLDPAAARLGAACHRRSRRLDHSDLDGLCRRCHASRPPAADPWRDTFPDRFLASCSVRPPAACSATCWAGATSSSCLPGCSPWRRPGLVFELAVNPQTRKPAAAARARAVRRLRRGPDKSVRPHRADRRLL